MERNQYNHNSPQLILNPQYKLTLIFLITKYKFHCTCFAMNHPPMDEGRCQCTLGRVLDDGENQLFCEPNTLRREKKCNSTLGGFVMIAFLSKFCM